MEKNREKKFSASSDDENSKGQMKPDDFGDTRVIPNPLSADEDQMLEKMLSSKKNTSSSESKGSNNGQAARHISSPRARRSVGQRTPENAAPKEIKSMSESFSGESERSEPEKLTDGAMKSKKKIMNSKNSIKNAQKKKKKRISDNESAYYAGEEDSESALSNVLKSIIYIVSVLLISVLISYFVIVFSNDVFAFVKDDYVAEITVDDTLTTRELSKILHEQGIIRYPSMFRMYHAFRGYGDEYKAGEYSVSANMGYDALIRTFLGRQSERQTVILTFYEGQMVDDIIDQFVEHGIGTREGFIDVIQNYPYEYEFLKTQIDDPHRKYRLEGYLFPDTYYFYADSNEATAIYKMLENFDTKINSKYYDRASELGMTMDNIVTIASMIQWESGKTAEFEYVSSVIHNRLKSPDYPKLECDSTIIYAIGGERKDRVDPKDKEINDPYNTYLYDGLPPGAIGNPGLDAIEAALYPASSDYYYFVADNDGTTVFSRTLYEHNAAIERINAGKK